MLQWPRSSDLVCTKKGKASVCETVPVSILLVCQLRYAPQRPRIRWVPCPRCSSLRCSRRWLLSHLSSPLRQGKLSRGIERVLFLARFPGLEHSHHLLGLPCSTARQGDVACHKDHPPSLRLSASCCCALPSPLHTRLSTSRATNRRNQRKTLDRSRRKILTTLFG